jgi:hypothetical protein
VPFFLHIVPNRAKVTGTIKERFPWHTITIH